jgi:DHA2 family multidrug resistance protein
LPFGLIAIAGLLVFMPRVEAGKNMRFDWIGFAILSIGLAALQIMLDRGEELDWFSSPTILVSAVLAVLGLYLFVVHLMTAKNPFIPRAAFGDLNFNASLVTIFSVGTVLLASSSLLAPFLENLGNYPVSTAGLIMAPRGFGTMGAMMIAGRLTNKVDPRLLMFFGYFLLGLSIYMLEGWTPAVSRTWMSITIIIQGAGLGFVFVPLQVVAFYTLSPSLRTQGTALLSLLRNVGSAIGVSVTSALLDHQSQYEHAVLSQYVTPFSRNLQAGGAASKLLDPASPQGASMLNSLINTQAQIIAYIDDYKLLFLTTIPSVLCLLLMRGPPHASKPQARPQPAE